MLRVLQINAVYERYSTGRTTREMHEWLTAHNVKSFVAASELYGLTNNCYRIGNDVDHKMHAFLSRVTGLQGYFSKMATKKLLKYIESIKPNVIVLRNLHANYINLKTLITYINRKNISLVLVLHDCWFFTGKCVYFHEDNCRGWKSACGNCPALKKGNPSLWLDRSKKMLEDKKKLFSENGKLAVVGVSNWVTNFVEESILKEAAIIKTIYNWINLDVFFPKTSADIRKKYNLSNKKIILGVSAIWSSQKGYEICCGLLIIVK